MNRIAAAVVLWLAILVSCGSAPPVPETPSAEDSRRPFLWRVDSADGAVAPSYLLGTFHIGVAPDDVLPPSVWSKLKSAKRVALEVNIAVPEALGLGMQPPGASLRDQMSTEQWTKLVRLLDLSPEEAAKIERVKVWVLVTSVLHELVADTVSIDSEVQRRAREAGAQLVFLEEIGFQQALFDRFMTADSLFGLLEHKEKQRAGLAEQIAAYRSGDVRRMYEQSLAPKLFSKSAPGAREALVFARNDAWILRMLPLIDGGALFAAVGVSHLIGERGIVALLRRRGYRVTRLTR